VTIYSDFKSCYAYLCLIFAYLFLLFTLQISILDVSVLDMSSTWIRWIHERVRGLQTIVDITQGPCSSLR